MHNECFNYKAIDDKATLINKKKTCFYPLTVKKSIVSEMFEKQ